MELFRDQTDRNGLADALNGLGIVHRRMGGFSRALEYYFEAHALYEELGETAMVAGLLNNIGIVYRRIDRHREAIDFYRRSLEIQQHEGNLPAVARLLNNIGVAYVHLGEPERALGYYERSLAIKQELADEKGIAYTLGNIGLAYKKSGDLDRATFYLKKAVDARAQINDRRALAEVLRYSADAHRQLGDIEKSVEELHRALEIAQEIQAQDDLRLIYWDLASTYEEKGELREALEYLKKYQMLNEDIFDTEERRTIAELEARYKTEEKEKEIELLKREQVIGELEIVKQKALRTAFAVGMGLLLVTSLLLYKNHRLREERIRQEERGRYISALETTNAEIEMKNAELERFVYTVSHDLKTPLVTIRGFLGHAKKDARSGELDRLRDDLAHIDKATEIMARLLNELLELSRIGRIINEPEIIELRELAEEAFEQVRGQIGDRDVTLEMAEDLPEILADRTRMLEVLQNLLDNAVKFTAGEPDPRIQIGVCGGHEETTIYVRDNGLGIDPRYHDRVFDLFERLDPTIDGTGVGLSIVRRIVEIHGGRVWIESDGRGRGTTVYLTLPPPVAHRA